MIRPARLFPVVALLLLAAGPPGKRALPVETRPVEVRALVYAIEATGSLETDERQVAAEVSGSVRTLAFEVGDAVGPDTVLATIDPETYALRAAKARASLARALAQLQEAENALARRRRLREANPGWMSEEEILQHAARLDESRATVEEARAEAGLAAENERRASLRPPVAGVIERRHVVQGQFVQTGALVATLVDPAALRLRMRVTALEASRLAKGQTVSFRVRGAEGKTFQATVFHVASQADPSTRTVECVARVDAAGTALKAGQFAEVRIVVETREQAMAVPESALLPTDRGYAAFVVDGATARRRTVTLGLHTADGLVEVLSGLSPGDRLVTRGAALLTDGAAVETVETKGN